MTGLHCIPHFCTKLLSVKLHQSRGCVLYAASRWNGDVMIASDLLVFVRPAVSAPTCCTHSIVLCIGLAPPSTAHLCAKPALSYISVTLAQHVRLFHPVKHHHPPQRMSHRIALQRNKEVHRTTIKLIRPRITVRGRFTILMMKILTLIRRG